MLLLPSTLLSYPHQAMMSLAALWVTPINLERKKININFSFLSVVIIYSHFFKRQSLQTVCNEYVPVFDREKYLGFGEILGGKHRKFCLRKKNVCARHKIIYNNDCLI